MFVSRVLSRLSQGVTRSSFLILSPAEKHHAPILTSQFHRLVFDSQKKLVASQMPLRNHSALDFSTFQWFGISSSAAPGASESEHGSTVASNGSKTSEEVKASGQQQDLESGEAEVPDRKEASGSNRESQHTVSQYGKRRRNSTKRIAFSDSDSEGEGDLSRDDLLKVLLEKEEIIKAKDKEIDRILRSYAERENVIDRTKRDAENSKKFAIQSFAKGLFDVADNLERASSVVKIDSYAPDGSVPVQKVKTILEGIEMTGKQLAEVFRKHGVEKFDPTNEPFDPHRHNAVFQIPDGSKPPGTVAVVLKSGYMLYDRVVRPADVGVTQAVEDEAENTDKGSEA